MALKKCSKRFAITALMAGFALAAVQAAEESPAAMHRTSFGTIVGIVTNSAKLPVAGATVTAFRIDDGAIRAMVSGSDGVYSFADLAPGAWSLTAEVDGYPDATVPSLQVAASKATRRDVVMNVTAEAPDAQPVPDALHSPHATQGVDNFTPFAFGDFTWLNGSPRNKAPVFDTKFFTPDIRFDAHYMADFNHPKDHTIVGSTESFRSNEFQLEQVSFGGDFHWENVRARFLSMMGLFATTTPRNDASQGVGQWDLRNAYRYLSEANAGYHFDVGHGLNVDAGIFVSYIGLFSYYNYDNWTYQPSFVSSNTPWFFNGLRVQYFPSNTLKIEPWIINGWQSYGRFNRNLGFGGQILWMPNEDLKLVFNNYGVGQDNLAYSVPGSPPNPLRNVNRVHTDDSIEYRWYNSPSKGLSKAAFSITLDAGCEYGGGIGGVSCTKGPNKTAFLGWMMYNRFWLDNDLYAITLGGGAMNNPGRYLTLLPPINGADAVSGTPYFTENPGQHAYQWDATINFQYMPKQWITWWAEAGFRHSDVPYFAGQGGVTPPLGNTGSPGNYVCNSGNSAGTSDPNAASGTCSTQGGVWYPDLRSRQATLSGGVLVKF